MRINVLRSFGNPSVKITKTFENNKTKKIILNDIKEYWESVSNRGFGDMGNSIIDVSKTRKAMKDLLPGEYKFCFMDGTSLRIRPKTFRPKMIAYIEGARNGFSDLKSSVEKLFTVEKF